MQLTVAEGGVIVGVDPVSRRALWEVLLKRKAHSAILLVTHFIDEADILADQVINVQTDLKPLTKFKLSSPNLNKESCNLPRLERSLGIHSNAQRHLYTAIT